MDFADKSQNRLDTMTRKSLRGTTHFLCVLFSLDPLFLELV